MNPYDFDLFVIGAGSGGVRAARTSAALGARVAIAEQRYLGGTCVNVGCVPKKLFVYASQYSAEFTASKGYGWRVNNPSFSWQHLIEQKNHEIARLNRVYESLLINAGVQLFDGHATLIDEHTVQIADQQVSAQYILIATGGRPFVAEFPGNDLVITSDQAFYLEHLPERIMIVGGGYIAVEFSCIFNGLGVETTLVYRGSLFLRGFDHEIRQHLARQLVDNGISLKFDSIITSVEATQTGLLANLASDEALHAGQIMYATGRRPNSAGLGLSALGIEVDEQGAVIVDFHGQTSVASIYAIGDVTNRMNLTPVALAEGMAVANCLFGDATETPLDYGTIPTCVFSQPNLASVGLTQQQAEQKYTQVTIYQSVFRPMKYSLTGIREQTLMKLVVDAQTDRVLGAHMVGPDAGEIIQGMAIAIKAGVTKTIVDSTIGIHPTAAEEFVTMRQPLSS